MLDSNADEHLIAAKHASFTAHNDCATSDQAATSRSPNHATVPCSKETSIHDLRAVLASWLDPPGLVAQFRDDDLKAMIEHNITSPYDLATVDFHTLAGVLSLDRACDIKNRGAPWYRLLALKAMCLWNQKSYKPVKPDAGLNNGVEHGANASQPSVGQVRQNAATNRVDPIEDLRDVLSQWLESPDLVKNFREEDLQAMVDNGITSLRDLDKVTFYTLSGIVSLDRTSDIKHRGPSWYRLLGLRASFVLNPPPCNRNQKKKA